MAGTNTNVANVAKVRPPMTARPSGAFCSPPSPSANAIGNIPRIIAIAVSQGSSGAFVYFDF